MLKRAFGAAVFAVATLGTVASAQAQKWSGPYIGANLGWARADSDLSIMPTNDVFSSNGFPMTQAGILANHPKGAGDSGAIAGVQIGYNWQATNWLFGLEADANFLGLESSFGHPRIDVALPGADNSVAGSISPRSLLTLRPRVGMAFDNLLVYATGGLALGRVKLSDTINVIGAQAGDATFTESSSETRVGWVLGGGVELKLTRNISAKVEYLHVDLGDISTVSALTGFRPAFPAANGSAFTVNSTLKEDIVRAGLNFHWN